MSAPEKPTKRGPKPPKRIRRSPLKRSSTPIARNVAPKAERGTNVAALKRKLWRLVSLYVRQRDENTCFTCGIVNNESGAMDAGHYVTAARHSTKFAPINIHAQCKSCNHHKKGNLHEYALRFRLKYGDEMLVKLLTKQREDKNWKAWELRDLIDAIKKSHADYELLYEQRHGFTASTDANIVGPN